MNADGSHVRQLCFDQDLDLHPSVLDNGQIIFSRWDYTGLLHAYVRPLMAMNPDGTVQLMRSWFTAMPGEVASCVGCHESPGETPRVRYELAMSRDPSELQPWYGPARGFDFAREVQPVLDQHCVGCHDGRLLDDGRELLDLRDSARPRRDAGLPLSRLGATRLHPSSLTCVLQRFSECGDMPSPYGTRRLDYGRAYEALIPYIRRVNVEDEARVLRPGEYHANTSPLIQMLVRTFFVFQAPIRCFSWEID